jgi:tight adherence protein B
MSPIIICIAVFLAVAALVGGVAFLVRSGSENRVEDRLAQLTGAKVSVKDSLLKDSGVLSKPLDATQGIIDVFLAKFRGFTLLFQQANTSTTPSRFFAICAALGFAGMVGGVVAGLSAVVAPVLGIFASVLPILWLVMRRRRRFKKFAKQLPDALELISRALRAGHSLASGFNLVAQEMNDPIATEFQKAFEEQNLGIALDQALEGMTERMPNLDLKFFATAVILQRQTGGDLAEILDKIGRLVRERFQIWGQVQALTGEGRLSGIVLLALPPALFVVVWRLNPDYVIPLFTDPLGKKMLAAAVIMQVLGALVIKKIVNIRV